MSNGRNESREQKPQPQKKKDRDEKRKKKKTARLKSIIVDFTRTPFRLEELKPIFSILKEAAMRK